MGFDADVAIVGYGPVGNCLAILLGQFGRSVVVLERWPEPYPLPRAVHFDHEVGRILQGCGIGDELRRITEPGDIYEWRNAAGQTLLRFGRRGDGPSGWPLSSMFHQPALEALLDQRAAELASVEVRRGVEVAGLSQDGDGVTLHIAHRGDVRARYVIGCDGANSTVRGVLDLPVHDLGYFYDWLVVDVILDEARVFEPLNLQIRDAANLAWKLDLVLDGRAPEWLLDTYQQERLRSAQASIEFAMELGKVICVPDPAEAAARDQAMAAAVGPEPADVPDLPGPETGIIHPASPHAGQLFMQPRVSGLPLDDVHGTGWRLVTVHDDLRALDPETVGWFESIGGRVVAVDRSDPLTKRWFSEHDATWALQRPDFYLYGTATDAATASTLLSELQSQLATDKHLEGATS